MIKQLLFRRRICFFCFQHSKKFIYHNTEVFFLSIPNSHCVAPCVAAVLAVTSPGKCAEEIAALYQVHALFARQLQSGQVLLVLCMGCNRRRPTFGLWSVRAKEWTRKLLSAWPSYFWLRHQLRCGRWTISYEIRSKIPISNLWTWRKQVLWGDTLQKVGIWVKKGLFVRTGSHVQWIPRPKHKAWDKHELRRSPSPDTLAVMYFRFHSSLHVCSAIARVSKFVGTIEL